MIIAVNVLTVVALIVTTYLSSSTDTDSTFGFVYVALAVLNMINLILSIKIYRRRRS